MYSHLVSIEVRVECGTYQGMQFDCLTFYQDRLKCLNTKSVQCRCTVQHNRMFLDHLFQHIPYLRIQSLYQLLGIFDILADSLGYQLFHYKRLEQFNCHFLGQTTLINFQFRSYDDNGTSGIVYTLT